MHVICARDQLADALGIVSSIVNQRSTNPITQNVLLIAGKNELEVQATDLDLSLKRTLNEIETKTPGKALVQAALVGGLLRDIRSETVELKVDGTSLTLTAGRDKFELTSADPEEFPKLAEVNADDEFVISARSFNDAIRKVGKSIAQEKGRYALNGVLLEPGKKGLEFCGTDGRRLGFSKIDCKAKKLGYQVIMPAKAYSLISKVLGSSGEDFKLRLSGRRVSAVVENTEVSALLVEGQFPDYRAVLPTDLDKSFTSKVEDLRLALNKAKHLTSVESQAVRLEVAPNELTLKTRSPAAGQAEVRTEIEYAGEETTIGFDPQYVLGGLEGFDTDTVTFEFKDKDTGAIMHAGDREHFYYLVMPIDI
ncbi:MAG: DNA polymerase III subunit beta [Planctomycetota bacterium]|jgi:DNA polymerase-3 subunit beta